MHWIEILMMMLLLHHGSGSYDSNIFAQNSEMQQRILRWVLWKVI